MRNNHCPNCGNKNISVAGKFLGVGLVCSSCGEKLTLEGYSSVFFGLLAFISFNFIKTTFELNYLVVIAIISPPILVSLLIFAPLATKAKKFNAVRWLYAIAALIVVVPFAGMGLYFAAR